MRFSKIIIFIMITIFIASTANGDTFYPFHLSAPIETTWEDIPAISVKVHLDHFPIKPCESCPGCVPPPVEYWVQIERQNPNGGSECWLRSFGVWGGSYGPYFRIGP